MKRLLAFIIMLTAVMILQPQYPAKMLNFVRWWPFLFSLIPLLSLLVTDGLSAVREVFSGRNGETRQKLQKRIIIFGFVSFLVQTMTVLKLLNQPDSIGPCITVWISLAFYLGIQSWFLS